jgi:hypothetical protein
MALFVLVDSVVDRIRFRLRRRKIENSDPNAAMQQPN